MLVIDNITVRIAGRTLIDGAQPAEETAHALAAFIGAARETVEIAIYDFDLPHGKVIHNYLDDEEMWK